MTVLVGFVFFGLFSPGPNVILLTTSGARFGFRATLPHLLGVALGVGVIAFVTALGLGALLEGAPRLRFALTVIAACWILWMAWKLWNAPPIQTQGSDRPFSFLEAILFQWVNPKIWAVALSASVLVPDLSLIAQAGILAITFSVTNLFVCLFWTYAGSLLKSLLVDPIKWQIFMRGMALALVCFSALVFL
ncbi:LysE family translocator [Octadecabacter sp. 1_MG-2023]|uniref:LysE family translocator n=1 Tax=unclassified Octadecabacter TaxID=196158 RepID=UPI001C0945D6|nr:MULTISPECIES: LysE family translocator [unclassified Octadecabacter]MBU2992293.1 LysE family translocator [Octadecabacter sp. B2R22]MDO6734950.1 LysE family translocator [Octadecabacter sp. 1_MG-2023]